MTTFLLCAAAAISSALIGLAHTMGKRKVSDKSWLLLLVVAAGCLPILIAFQAAKAMFTP